MEVFLEALRADGVDIDEYLNVDDPQEKKGRERNLQNYMDGFSSIKREMLTEADVHERFTESPDVWRVYSDYQNALLNSRGIDYDDILRYAHRILLTQPWTAEIYRAKYSHICVDEAQDLNRIQYEFIRALAGSEARNVMMVGDPGQMIYGFNGSSSAFFCEHFLRDFSPSSFRLTENYRSSRAVVRAANSLRPGAQQESEFALEGVAQATSFDSEEEEAKWIISSVQSLLETQTHPEIEGEISLANMVVIARNRFVFTKLQEALSESNIDYNLKIGEREKLPISLFGQVLDLAIRLKLNPSDWVDGEKLCQLIGISPPNEWGDEALLKQFHSAVVATGRPQSGLIANLITKIDELESENPNILKFEKLFEKQIRGFAALENNETRNLEFDRSLVELREFSDRWNWRRTSYF